MRWISQRTENNTAIDHIEKAFNEHDAYVLWSDISPDWNLLRSEPRFQQLLRRHNFTASQPKRPTMGVAEISHRSKKRRRKYKKQG